MEQSSYLLLVHTKITKEYIVVMYISSPPTSTITSIILMVPCLLCVLKQATSPLPCIIIIITVDNADDAQFFSLGVDGVRFIWEFGGFHSVVLIGACVVCTFAVVTGGNGWWM